MVSYCSAIKRLTSLGVFPVGASTCVVGDHERAGLIGPKNPECLRGAFELNFFCEQNKGEEQNGEFLKSGISQVT